MKLIRALLGHYTWADSIREARKTDREITRRFLRYAIRSF